MIFEAGRVAAEEFAQRTGWEINAQRACKNGCCVPLPPSRTEELLDLGMLAECLSMPLVCDEEAGLWSIGPQAGGRALASALSPALRLPTINGATFELASLRGWKVLLLAWASW